MIVPLALLLLGDHCPPLGATEYPNAFIVLPQQHRQRLPLGSSYSYSSPSSSSLLFSSRRGNISGGYSRSIRDAFNGDDDDDDYENVAFSNPPKQLFAETPLNALSSMRGDARYFDDTAIDDDDDLDYDDYDDEFIDNRRNAESVRFDTETVSLPAIPKPGNFWMNPLSDVDGGAEELRRSQRRSTEGSSSSQSPRQQPQPQPRSSGRRDRRMTQASSTFGIGNTRQPSPSPFLELYERLFWYGLDDTDDNERSDYGDDNNDGDRSSTMFGGTKGKFNGLSFLYDSEGSVPFNEQRPKRSTQSQRTPRTLNDNNGQDRYYRYQNDDDPYNNQDTSAFNRPVTPPYDPPIVPPSSKRSSRRTSGSDRQRHDGNGLDRNDWVVRAVDSWFPLSNEDSIENAADTRYNDDGYDYDNDNDEIDASATRDLGRKQRRNDRSSNIIQPITNALETFLGLDRDVLQKEADAYQKKMGLGTSSTGRYTTRSTDLYVDSIRPKSRQRPFLNDASRNVKEPENELQRGDIDSSRTTLLRDKTATDVIQQPVAHAEIDDIVEASISVEDSSTVLKRDQNQPTSTGSGNNGRDIQIDKVSDDSNYQSTVTPLSFDERISAIERVPPIGVTAWGINGVIEDCDARTKAFQDAIIDVQLVQEQIDNYQQQISSLQDNVSLLHMDIKLSKHRVEKIKREQQQQHMRQRNGEYDSPILLKRLIEQIRDMENHLNALYYDIRYKRLQKGKMMKKYHTLMQRRHWAIFHTMKHVTTDETILSEPINEALYELEMNEPAARRYSMKRDEKAPDTGSGR